MCHCLTGADGPDLTKSSQVPRGQGTVPLPASWGLKVMPCPSPDQGSLGGLYRVLDLLTRQRLGTRVQTCACCLWASKDPHLNLEPRDQPAHPDGGPSTRRQSPGSLLTEAHPSRAYVGSSHRARRPQSKHSWCRAHIL